MTLTQLKYFCETCRCHSITSAANELYVTQPAISLAIKELEAEFDITLFTRINNKLSLTEDGARFYERASYILQYCNDMQFDVCINKNDMLGEPKIGRRFKGIIWLQGQLHY